MSYFDWNPSWITGIPVIDQQHMGLVAEVDRFFYAIRDGQEQDALDRILIHLSEYVESHFRTEEGLMVETGYPDFPSHKAAHEALWAKVKGLVEAHLREAPAMTPEVIEYLKDWLVDHLYTADRVMAAHLRRTLGSQDQAAEP